MDAEKVQKKITDLKFINMCIKINDIKAKGPLPARLARLVLY